jgi:hypothetical protein
MSVNSSLFGKNILLSALFSILDGVFGIFHWQVFRPHYGSGVDSASNSKECQEYFLEGGKGGRCVGLTILLPSCADCLEIWEPQTLGIIMTCPDLYRYCFTFKLFSGILSLRSSLNVSDHISHPYKTTDKIILLYILIFTFG